MVDTSPPAAETEYRVSATGVGGADRGAGRLPSTARWSDPLFSPGDVFPLGPPQWTWSGSGDAPSADLSVRPFSLRGVVAGASLSEPPPPYRFTYSPERQTATVTDAHGTVVELAKHTKAGPTKPDTTGTTDGDPKNPPPEETGAPDYQND